MVDRNKMLYPNGNSCDPAAYEQAYGMAFEIVELEGETIKAGRDPRKMSVAVLNVLGHEERPLLHVIRENCKECQGGAEAEVRRCANIQCPFWPYRMNVNPFRRREMTPEQRAAAGERLKKARETQVISRISD